MADLGAGAIFGGINTLFRFSEFVIRLNEVGGENDVFVRTIQNVRSDLFEVERLLHVSAIKTLLSQNPEKKRWIDEKIYSTKQALNEIGLYVERARSDKERDGKISFGHRVRWVMNDHEKLENRRAELTACHQSLTLVLGQLHVLESRVEGLAEVKEDGYAKMEGSGPPPTYEVALGDAEFMSPYNRRKKGSRKERLIGGLECRDMKQDTLESPQASDAQKHSSSNPNFLSNTKIFTRKPCQASDQEIKQDGKEQVPGPETVLVPPVPVAELDSCNATNPFGPVSPWELFDEPAASSKVKDTRTTMPSPTVRVPPFSALTSIASPPAPAATSSYLPLIGSQHRPQDIGSSTVGYPSPVSPPATWNQSPFSAARDSSNLSHGLVQMIDAVTIGSARPAQIGSELPAEAPSRTREPVTVEMLGALPTPTSNERDTTLIQLTEVPAQVARSGVTPQPGTNPYFSHLAATASRPKGGCPAPHIPMQVSPLNGPPMTGANPYFPHLEVAANSLKGGFSSAQVSATPMAAELQGNIMANTSLPPPAASYTPWQTSSAFSTAPHPPISTSSTIPYPPQVSPVSPPVALASQASQEATMYEPLSRTTTIESQKRRRRRAMMDAALGLGD